MTQEEKDLVVKDLCGRLPYGVMLKHISAEKPFKLFSIKRDEYASYKKDGVELAVNGIYYDWYVNDIYHDIELYIKPYLRPMNSMTEEEQKEYHKTFRVEADTHGFTYIESFESFDWLTAHHFDFRDLISKGLALEASQGMYNN